MKANTLVAGPRSVRVILLALIVVSALVVTDNFVLPNAAGTAKTAALPPPTDLFISEYIEGTAQNKAIEIFNGTTLPIDLGTGNYVLQLYSNGSATVSQSHTLSGVVSSGDVFVIAHPMANAAILAQADDSSSVTINFNGDDAFVLRKGGGSGPIVDVIGQVGFDPGTEWGTGLASTVDNTLVRKSSVSAGDTNPSDSFDPAVQWDGFATDTFTNLGSHSVAPSAADVSVGGRVATADGRGIRNIRITVSGGDLSGPRAAITSPFGYYRVDGLTAGETYVVTAVGKRYVFEVPARLVSLGEDAFDIDFIGEVR